MKFIAYALGMVEADKWNPIESLGATGATVAENVKRLRKDRGLAYTELSNRLAQLGRTIPPLGLRKIESGGRRVDADDLVALSIVLGVSPAALLMPELSTVTQDDLVPITGWHKPITATVVWDWLTAERPLVKSSFLSSSFLSFANRSWPSWEKERFLQHAERAVGDHSVRAKMESADGDD